MLCYRVDVAAIYAVGPVLLTVGASVGDSGLRCASPARVALLLPADVAAVCARALGKRWADRDRLRPGGSGLVAASDGSVVSERGGFGFSAFRGDEIVVAMACGAARAARPGPGKVSSYRADGIRCACINGLVC